MNEPVLLAKMMIPGIGAWISGGAGHWEQVPGSLGGCPGATGVCWFWLIFAEFAGFAGHLSWVNLRVRSGYVSRQTVNSRFGSQF